MRKHYERIVAGMLTAAMIVPMTDSIVKPVSASAYELLGETDFEHKMIPWMPVSANSAKQDFDISGGDVHIRIIEPYGTNHVNSELTFRHNGLSFKKDHKYKVSFKVRAKREGMQLCSSICSTDGAKHYFMLDGNTGDMHIGPDFGGQWGKYVELGTEYKEYSGDFYPTQDLEDVMWEFRYAEDVDGFGGDAIKGDEIWFDDMSIEDITDTETVPEEKTYGYTARRYSGLENNYISVNQLGYYTGRVKTAVLGDDSGDVINGAKPIELSGSYEFEIVNTVNDAVVYTGETAEAKKDRDSGDTVCKIDFTEFDTDGEYYIRIKDKEWRSFPFRIGRYVYTEDLLIDALNFFYQNRSGCDIEVNYITSGDAHKLTRKAGNDEGTGFVQKEWVTQPQTDAQKVVEECSSRIDVSGGWFDGTDFTKDMGEGALTVWTLQNMYERAIQTKSGREDFADGAANMVIPEQDNGYPDILDECRYELDFMAKMKVQQDEPTWGDYAGLYYNGLQGVNFEPYPKDYEHEFHSALSVQPPTFAATLNYAACAAQGARLWAPYDKEYAQKLLESAKEAYQAYKKYYYEAADDEEQNALSLYSPGYRSWNSVHEGDIDVTDEAYWAAAELFISTAVMEDAEAEKYQNGFRDDIQMEINGSGRDCFNAGTFSLVLNEELLDDTRQGHLQKKFLKRLAPEMAITAKGENYGLPYLYDHTGSNRSALYNMMLMAYAYDKEGVNDLMDCIVSGMDHLFGKNPLSISYVTGYGTYTAKNPSHRVWRKEEDKTLPAAPVGILVSGPDTGYTDPYMRGLGLVPGEDHPPTLRYYADSVGAWSSNGTSLSANAALAWMVYFMVEEKTEPATTPPASPATGDINRDGKFTVADVVMLRRYLLGDPRVIVEYWQDADFYDDDILDTFDYCIMVNKLKSELPDGAQIDT